jgi:hypothetical protein
MVGSRQLREAEELLRGRDAARPLLIALHHHVIAPAFSILMPFLLCLDRDEVLHLAQKFGAQAIVHGHTHQPFVYQHESGLLIVSCGSARFRARGRFAEDVGAPSFYGLTIEDHKVTAIALLKAE